MAVVQVEFAHRIASSPVSMANFYPHEASLWQPPASRSTGRVQLDSCNLPIEKASCFGTNRCAPSPAVWCTPSASSCAKEGFRGCRPSKVSPSLNAVFASAVAFSRAASAIATVVQRKASWDRIPQQHAVGVNFLLTGFGSCSIKILTRKWFGTAQKSLRVLEGSQEFADGLRGNLMQQGGLSMALLSTTVMAKDRISPVVATLCANPTFMSGLVAWTVAQILKIFTTFFVEKRWDLKMLVGSGGMPSSHSALCVALTTSVAVCNGISNTLFPVCLGFSLIVMYDATGVRRHAGMQAEVLNLIVDDLFQGHPVSGKKLKELLGHTPLQVGAGAFVGIVTGYLCSQGYSTFPGHGF